MLVAGLRDLSPVNWVRKDSPPFLLIHGTADSLVPFEQSKTMCDKMVEAGGACELYPVRGGGHGIRWWESSSLTAYKHHMVRWLEKQLRNAEVAFDGRRNMPTLQRHRVEGY
jgi:dipeptidyl aminopeptidase/acylaminoacyl peptidase